MKFFEFHSQLVVRASVYFFLAQAYSHEDMHAHVDCIEKHITPEKTPLNGNTQRKQQNNRKQMPKLREKNAEKLQRKFEILEIKKRFFFLTRQIQKWYKYGCLRSRYLLCVF